LFSAHLIVSIIDNPMKHFWPFFAISLLLFSANSRAQSWKAVDGPKAWGVSSFLFDDKGNIIADSRTGTYLSVDQGTTWQLILASDITGYAVTGKGHLLASSSSGLVQVSTNLGKTWGTEYFATNSYLSTIASINNIAYSAADSFIFTSNDEVSRNFDRWELGDGKSVVKFAPAIGFVLASVSIKKIDTQQHKYEASYLVNSIDQGKTWSDYTPVLDKPMHYLVTDAAGEVFGGTGSSVLQLDQSSKSWNDLHAPTGMLVSLYVTASGDLYAAIGPDLQTSVVYRSRDKGQTWQIFQPKGESGVGVGVYGPSIYIATFADGVWKTTDDGLSWVHQNYGGGANVYFLSFSHSNQLFASLGNLGLRMSIDLGLTWSVVSNKTAGEVFVLPSGKLIFGTDSSRYYSSLDGVNWTLNSSPLFPARSQLTADKLGAIYQRNNLSDSGLLSSDEGATWLPIPRVPSFVTRKGVWFFGPQDRGIGPPDIVDSIYRSIDSGKDLVNITPARLSSDTISYYPFGEGSDGTIYGIVSHSSQIIRFTNYNLHALVRSTDNGTSWQPTNLHIYGDFWAGFITQHDTMYIGTDSPDSAIFRSIDNGITWQLFSQDITGYFTDDLDFGPSNSIFAVVGERIFSYGVTSSVFNHETVPTSVLGVSPNPASGRLRITSQAKSGSIEIYDVTGRLRARSELSNSRSELSLSGFSDGCYLVRLTYQGGAATSHVIVQH
jgi:photosystem II stability/assembly factor-like uncharacterized protein